MCERGEDHCCCEHYLGDEPGCLEVWADFCEGFEEAGYSGWWAGSEAGAFDFGGCYAEGEEDGAEEGD